ncbi:hypothetical protein D3C87_1695670 [compost metagenome]
MKNCQHVRKKRTLREVKAKQLRYLVDHDHYGDARLEADQYRLRNKAGQVAKPQERRGDQHDANQQRQRCRGNQQLRGVAARHGAIQRCRGKDGERGRCADTKRPGCAEEGVNQHRHERGVEPHLNR